MCNRGKVGSGWPVCSHSMDKKALIYAAPLTKSSQKSCRGYLLQLVQSICKSPLSWVLRAIAGILMPLVFLSEQTIKCSVQGEPPARFHFNIGISQANYNSGSQEVPGEGICQPRCIGHWLWSSCKAHLTTWVRPQERYHAEGEIQDSTSMSED